MLLLDIRLLRHPHGRRDRQVVGRPQGDELRQQSENGLGGFGPFLGNAIVVSVEFQVHKAATGLIAPDFEQRNTLGLVTISATAQRDHILLVAQDSAEEPVDPKGRAADDHVSDPVGGEDFEFQGVGVALDLDGSFVSASLPRGRWYDWRLARPSVAAAWADRPAAQPILFVRPACQNFIVAQTTIYGSGCSALVTCL